MTSTIKAGLCYVTAKAVGGLALTSYLIYSKKYKNVELFRNEIERYNFNPILDPLIQISESIVYAIWAIWWYSVTSDNDLRKFAGQHLPLVFLLTTILGHILGLMWLYCKPHLKQPLEDPRSVLKFIQTLEYIRT